MTAVTNEEIVAVADGAADRATERRVMAAALIDPQVRVRLRDARAMQEAPRLVAEREGGFSLRAQRLKEEMEIAVRRVARENREQGQIVPTAARAGPLMPPLRRVLESVRFAVTLPCLAPASASSLTDLSVRRDLFLVDGVRIELQQLPGESPRLRAFGDASGVSGGFAATEANALELTLEGLGELVIPLNSEGRGYADFSIGGPELPAPRTSVHLTEAALIRRESR